MKTVEHNSERVEIEMNNSAGSPRGPRHKSSEDGFTLLTVIFLLTIITIWMSVAVPKMTRAIQRDREVETMHRGKQYIRAVQLYYRKFHAYPPTLDALVKTNDIRFLRKKYIDPMTGKNDWKPLMFGQNKAPTVMGFFGQPLATSSSLAGIGMSGGNGIAGLNSSNCASNASGTLGSIFNSQNTQNCSGATATTGPGLGTNGTDSSGNTTGPNGTDSSGNTTGTNGTGSGTGATDANGNPIAGSGTNGTGTGPNGSGSGTNGLTSSGPTAGQTFGGAGIIGVTPASPKVSLLIYKKKTHYNEWEFDYDPAMETMMQGGNTGMIGTSASSMTNPIGNSGFGSNNNTFGGGQTGSTPFSANPGSQNPTSPTSPTSPQQ
jgi:type II secretory pathway pseudopilin PulG